MKKLSLITVLLFCSAALSQAGLWSNLNDAQANLINMYNTDMLATGDSVISSMQTTGPLGGKLNSAFDNYHNNIVVTGDHALENSKAVYKALRDIAMWLPDQLKKLWEKFVAWLQSIRDKLNALNEQLGGSKASNTMARGLGDGFVERFAAAKDINLKLSIFSDYWTLVDQTGTKVLGLEEKYRNELLPKMTPVANECMAIEECLIDDLVSCEENITTFAKLLDSKESAALQQLAEKVQKRLKASVIHGDNARMSRTLLEKLSTK